MRLFLIGDTASCAKNGQKVREGFYIADPMLKKVSGNAAPSPRS